MKWAHKWFELWTKMCPNMPKMKNELLWKKLDKEKLRGNIENLFLFLLHPYYTIIRGHWCLKLTPIIILKKHKKP